MPTYDFMCTDAECGHEWEVWASIKDEPTKICPKCNKETAKRLISGGSGKGIVTLEGQELLQKTKEDTVKLKKEVYSNENLYANMVGEDKYQSTVTHYEKQKNFRR